MAAYLARQFSFSFDEARAIAVVLRTTLHNHRNVTVKTAI